MTYCVCYAHDDGLKILFALIYVFSTLLRKVVDMSESKPSKCVLGERELEFGRSVLDLDLG